MTRFPPSHSLDMVLDCIYTNFRLTPNSQHTVSSLSILPCTRSSRSTLTDGNCMFQKQSTLNIHMALLLSIRLFFGF